MDKGKYLSFVIGILILAMFVCASLFPEWFTSYGQKEMFPSWETPSASHLLGTNALGYDIFTEIVYGTKDTLSIGLLSSILGLAIGAVIGILASQKGVLGFLMNGLINLFVLLPRLITILVLSAFIGSGRNILIILIAAFTWSGAARAVKAQVEHIQAMPFMEACRIQGFTGWHIAVFHILPNLKDILLSRFLMGVNSCIMMESTLSFLGMGDLYHPSWGTMMNFAYRRGALLRQAYPYLLAPGFCIMLLSLSFYLISTWIVDQREEIGTAK